VAWSGRNATSLGRRRLVEMTPRTNFARITRDGRAAFTDNWREQPYPAALPNSGRRLSPSVGPRVPCFDRSKLPLSLDGEACSGRAPRRTAAAHRRRNRALDSRLSRLPPGRGTRVAVARRRAGRAGPTRSRLGHTPAEERNERRRRAARRDDEPQEPSAFIS